MNDNMQKLANLFKERNNPVRINICVGEVISTNPWRIKYGDNIILEKRHLIFADSVLNGYTREVELTGVQIEGLTSDSGSISFHQTGNPPSNDYTITDLSIPQSNSSKITATMKYTNNALKNGDKVILVPDNDFKKWYVLDKAVSL